VLALKPDHAPALQNLALLLLSGTLDFEDAENSHRKDALMYLRALVALREKSPETHHLMAAALHHLAMRCDVTRPGVESVRRRELLEGAVRLGLGRIVALFHRSSTSYHNR
jgi:hypothetical protein